MLSNGILIGEVAPGGLRAEYDDARVPGSLGLREFAAAQERDAHGRKIAGRDGVHPKKRFRRGSGGNIVFNFDDALLHSASERRRVDQGGVCKGWKGANPINQVAIEREATARVMAEGFVGRD